MKILKAYYLYFLVIVLVIAFCIYQVIPKVQNVQDNIKRIAEMETKVNDLNVKYTEVQKRQNIENMKYANLEQKSIFQPKYTISYYKSNNNSYFIEELRLCLKIGRMFYRRSNR